MMTAYADRKRDEHNTAVYLEWLNARLVRAEKMPDLDELLLKDGNRKAGPELTAEQKDAVIAANLRALRKRFSK